MKPINTNKEYQEYTKAFLFQKAHGRQAPGFQKLF